MAEKSRAEYFRERRKQLKQFNVSIEREKLERFERFLASTRQTKTEWLNAKIDEELGK